MDARIIQVISLENAPQAPPLQVLPFWACFAAEEEVYGYLILPEHY